MYSLEEIKNYLKELKLRFKKEMPKVRRELMVYEERKNNNQLTENPSSGPQFNG